MADVDEQAGAPSASEQTIMDIVAAEKDGGDSPKSEDAAPPVSEATPPVGDGELSFRENLRNKFDLMWHQRVEPMQRVLDQVSQMLRARSELERQYSSSIADLPNTLQPELLQGSMKEAVEAVAVSFKNRSEQANEVADQIEQDIVSMFDEVSRQHRDVSKRVLADAQRLTKYVHTTREAHDRLSKKYGSACLDAEQLALECNNGVAMRTSERTKLATRALMSSRQARVAEMDYYNGIEQVNRAQALFDQQMPAILDTCQDMEEKRATCLRDGLMKLAVYETSWLRNLQYDLDAMIKATEGSDPKKDVQDFIRAHVAQGERSAAAAAPFVVGALPFFELARPRPAKPLTHAKSAQLEGEAFFKTEMESLQPLVSALFAEEPPENFAEESKEGLRQLREGLDNTCRRAALCNCLRYEVSGRLPEGTPLENATPLRVAPANFETIVGLFKEALNCCDKSQVMDVWNARDLMVFSQVFQTTSADSDRTVSLLSRIYAQPIWSKVSYWEDLLLIGLCEACSAESMLRRTMTPGMAFQQVTMTTFLQHFVQYMAAFGIKSDQGRACVQATVKKHAALLGPGGEQYAELMLQGKAEGNARPAEAAGPESGREDTSTTAASTENGGNDPMAPAEEAAEEEDPFEAMAFGAASDDTFEAVALGAAADDSFEKVALGFHENLVTDDADQAAEAGGEGSTFDRPVEQEAGEGTEEAPDAGAAPQAHSDPFE